MALDGNGETEAITYGLGIGEIFATHKLNHIIHHVN